MMHFSSNAKRLDVGRDKTYKSIKTALSVARAFDTILVFSGTYKEGNIVVSRPVILLGKDLPILDGQKKYEIISIRSHFVTIKGFQLQHSGVATLDDPGAIKVYDHNFITISDNVLEDNFFGIYIQYGKHCTIKNNKIKSLRRPRTADRQWDTLLEK